MTTSGPPTQGIPIQASPSVLNCISETLHSLTIGSLPCPVNAAQSPAKSRIVCLYIASQASKGSSRNWCSSGNCPTGQLTVGLLGSAVCAEYSNTGGFGACVLNGADCCCASKHPFLWSFDLPTLNWLYSIIVFTEMSWCACRN